VDESREAKFPFPYRCEYSPRFHSQHVSALFIEEYQHRGYIKNCIHLENSRFGGGGWSATEYGPDCREDSFHKETVGGGRYAFYGCPEDCRLYEPAWKGKAKKSLRVWRWSLQRWISGFGKWYASLSMPVQVILALALLALVGAPWRETILEGLRIIFGK